MPNAEQMSMLSVPAMTGNNAVSSSANTFAISQSAAQMKGPPQQYQKSYNPSLYQQAQERALTGKGAYDLTHAFDGIELEDAEDEDEYSDDFEDDKQYEELKEPETPSNTEVRKIKELYEMALQHDVADSSQHFQQYEFSDTFIRHQEAVQNAYGPDCDIYRTLNPQGSKAKIKPPNERHAE